MSKVQTKLGKEFEEISGVRDVSTIVTKRRNAFEHALIDVAEDKTLGYLVAFGNKNGAREEHGLLRGLILDLRGFQDKYLLQQENFFESDAQRNELEVIFAKAMREVINKWPLLAKQGYDWGVLCKALSDRMESVAGVFGLSQPMGNSMAEWFVEYRKGQTTEQKYRERDEMNQKAVRAYSELAYLSAVGASQVVMDQVRQRIAGIDKELTRLPVDPRSENVPAFSKFNPQQTKRVIIDEPTVITRRPQMAVARPEPVAKKSFWKKLQFWKK